MAYNEQKNKIQSKVDRTIKSVFMANKVVAGSSAPAVGDTSVPLGMPVEDVEVPYGKPVAERASFWDWALWPQRVYHRHNHLHIHIGGRSALGAAAVPAQRTEQARKEEEGKSERKAKSEPSMLAILFVVTLLCFCIGAVAWLCCSYVPDAYGRLAKRISNRFSRGMKGVRYLKHHLMNLLEVSVACLGMISGVALALSASAMIGGAFGVPMAVLTGVGAWAVGLLALFVGLSALLGGALAVNAFVGLKHWWSGPMSWGSDASRMHSSFREKLALSLETPDKRQYCMQQVQEALGLQAIPGLSELHATGAVGFGSPDTDPGQAFLEDLTVQVLRAGYKLAKQESFVCRITVEGGHTQDVRAGFRSAYEYCKKGKLNNTTSLSAERPMGIPKTPQQWVEYRRLNFELTQNTDLLRFIHLHATCLGWVLQEGGAHSSVREPEVAPESSSKFGYPEAGIVGAGTGMGIGVSPEVAPESSSQFGYPEAGIVGAGTGMGMGVSPEVVVGVPVGNPY